MHFLLSCGDWIHPLLHSQNPGQLRGLQICSQPPFDGRLQRWTKNETQVIFLYKENMRLISPTFARSQYIFKPIPIKKRQFSFRSPLKFGFIHICYIIVHVCHIIVSIRHTIVHIRLSQYLLGKGLFKNDVTERRREGGCQYWYILEERVTREEGGR